MFNNMESVRTYFRLFIDEAISIGVGSIIIVAIVSTFIGAVTAVQTAYNIVSPLIEDYIIGNIVRDMTILELAPTITAIVFAGKVGSNIAGQLGTMRITDQIDALEVMGINSVSYLVFPKILASMIMYPMLVILAAFLSLYGGFLAATLSGLSTAQDYIYGIRFGFNEFTITFMLVKSVVFAFLVSSISSYKGYYTQGGALEVGESSTKAVTTSCIAILVADYLLAEIMLN
ncbi:putative phospholipid ABC transporter permease protein mlaE [Cesiribacter andamanensis AMV16]|uniref:Putative phospholipid ABC transporter permease protein mlaE n=2 Tax=Cesiribacter TaxID=1133570 RepID=M7NMM0_9BACT|nr:putative phospholipid ABC transporter permease protein mlaE [Cesiribacter andamanensis AMV16]